MLNDQVSIGKHCLISADVKFGKDVKIFNYVNLYGCEIKDSAKIGSFVEIQKGATIGEKCKISSHSFICEGVKILAGVFIGHNVTFINDKYPMAINQDGTIQDESDWDVVSTIIEKKVSIGSSSTILCGLTIGEGSIIGAGSVVTHNVPPGQIWAGNPARYLKDNL